MPYNVDKDETTEGNNENQFREGEAHKTDFYSGKMAVHFVFKILMLKDGVCSVEGSFTDFLLLDDK